MELLEKKIAYIRRFKRADRFKYTNEEINIVTEILNDDDFDEMFIDMAGLAHALGISRSKLSRLNSLMIMREYLDKKSVCLNYTQMSVLIKLFNQCVKNGDMTPFDNIVTKLPYTISVKEIVTILNNEVNE